MNANHPLTLRSGLQGRVSKGGQQTRCSYPPFETAASRPPQGEVTLSIRTIWIP